MGEHKPAPKKQLAAMSVGMKGHGGLSVGKKKIIINIKFNDKNNGEEPQGIY